jgi:hypothetical protein
MLVPQEEDTVVEEADLIQDIIQVWPMILLEIRIVSSN